MSGQRLMYPQINILFCFVNDMRRGLLEMNVSIKQIWEQDLGVEIYTDCRLFKLRGQ